MKALPLVVVMLLVASPVLGAVGPTDGSSHSSALDGATHAQVESPSNETIHVLDIPSSELVRSTVEAHHVDLGPSLDFSALRAGGRIQTGASLERIESASDDSTRQQLILDELNGIEQRAIALQSAQRSVIERFNDDNLTARELLIELARIDAEARALNERRVALRDVTSRTSDFSISSGRLAALERELDTFTGPVRTHAVAVMTGEADAARFSVRTSETGVVLSVVADGEYVREAYRADLRDRDQRTVTYEEALDIVAENYPTIYSSRTAQNGTNVISAGDSHRVRINYNYGQLTAYVDTGSGRVFKESQTRPLRSISISATATGVRDGLALTVDRTYPGGPLRIQLNESETGDPVDANVTIGLEASQESTLLGHTGSDGTLWTVSPSAPYTVTVIKGNSAVVLTADPTPTPTLAANPTDTENDTSPTVTSTPTESTESPGPSRTVPQGAPGDSPTVGSPTVG
ncbi:hypothetical protein G3A49_01760 [Haloferax volcanii]|uniref:Uncharacterized protein n=1 Tax=Haloferax volcanii TaxID=2246 RepID=A0A6C0URB1_HALVO|nr:MULTISPECIES: hypothetical protein [Haloferax]NLV01312.1 hypothetical protein [Haloferax alexandrinus]QIB76941.1 hypothetical protein G3A49_01760 [Haloferax alexandrinus]TVT95666.1 hypothetical protein FQA18_05185 [Haloferax volcanii]